jgi:hypothetical protein
MIALIILAHLNLKPWPRKIIVQRGGTAQVRSKGIKALGCIGQYPGAGFGTISAGQILHASSFASFKFITSSYVVKRGI